MSLKLFDDSPDIDNECNLVGTFGIIVQVILVLLIFTAVKSRLVIMS